ncbi:MAG: uroporphyrinogen decarboxylase family protein [Phycisphaerae bacterium]|nr:uroporphyrinogen decarboxylase family protein [Phycisphaerae bacterium]
MPDIRHISVLGSVSFGWLHAHGGFLFDEGFFFDAHRRFDQERRMREFIAERFPDVPIYCFEAHLVQVEGRRRPVALVGGLQPNLILGAAVGARFVISPEKDPDISPEPLAGLTDVGPLWNIDWLDTWPISFLLAQIREMRRALGPDMAVIPPFFWDTTGRATTHGIITTAQKLLGERVFLEMADNPEFVRELFAWIVDAYVKLIHLFADAAGISVTGLHTGECSGCMMGPDQFAEFAVPCLNDLADRVGPLRLHSCGNSNHLLDVLREVRNVAILNLGSGTSVAAVRDRFGPIRIDIMPETHLLTAGSPQDMDAWVRQCVADNGDARMQFEYHLDLNQPEENCLQIHRTLEEMGVHSPRMEVH